eukprot:scaffold1804_cov66-Cyclotella_meneghiniana.AAC.4
MAKERPFQTWTFDSPCDTMEWSPDSSVKLVSGDEADADLVLVGVFAPATKEDVDEDENEDEEIGELLLEGDALELDNKLGGMLKDLAAENKKEFKNGGESGGVTPAGRVSDGGKPGYLYLTFQIQAKRYVLLGLGPQPKEPIGECYESDGALW